MQYFQSKCNVSALVPLLKYQVKGIIQNYV